MKINYDTIQLTQAARHIWKKNPVTKDYYNSVLEVENYIINQIKFYNEDIISLSFMGIVILFSREDPEDDYGVRAEILIDPGCGFEPNFVSLELA